MSTVPERPQLPVLPPRSLRFGSDGLLLTTPISNTSLGRRSFSILGPRLWEIPQGIAGNRNNKRVLDLT